MKKYLPYIAILLFAMLMVSCQKEQVIEEVIRPNTTVEAQERCIQRCEECPTMTHCCCKVRIIEPTPPSSEIRFCGDFLGCGHIAPCIFGGTFTCPPINGLKLIGEFSAGDTLLLCIPQDEAFIIRNPTPFIISVEIECQQASGPPVVIPIDLDNSEFAIIEVNENCIPDQCN